MIARPRIGTFTVTFHNFGGTEDHCMKECQYDALCSGVLYSSTLKQCIKAVLLERTDDSNRIEEFSANWSAFAKTTSPVSYYANFCGQFAGIGTCTPQNTNNQCRWGVGDRGYNQMRHTDYGYCGRVACDRTLG